MPTPVLSRRRPSLVLAPVATAIALAFAVAARAEVKLHPLFTDHAVLQQGLPLPVWGTADRGEQVTVEFAGQKKTATAAPASSSESSTSSSTSASSSTGTATASSGGTSTGGGSTT